VHYADLRIMPTLNRVKAVNALARSA
jgi:hypothetical protein